MYTYSDGAFEYQQQTFDFPLLSLNRFNKDVPIEFWRDFLKNILTNEDVVKEI